MDTLDFFKRVLPTDGMYCAVIINGGAPQQTFFDTVEELATACQGYDAGGNNTYYATSTFINKFKRTQVNVKLSKSLFIDIDCGADKAEAGTGYATQKLGLAALVEFITANSLPMPMVVSSGRGIHVYWTMDKAVQPHEWQPLADALKNKFQTGGFLFDPVVTADSARVLRPIGTHNPKNGAEVKLLMDGAPQSYQTLQNLLGSVNPSAIASAIPALPNLAAPASPLSIALGQTSSFSPSNPNTVYSKCQQVQWGVDNQDKVSEPMWYLLIGIAAHCENPATVAKAWSINHPNYTEANTLKKLSQWTNNTTGPATCKRFKDERPKGCDKCPVAGSITSPAQCGTQFNEVGMAVDLPQGIDPTLEPPKMYKMSDAGMVVSLDGTEIVVCPFHIHPVSYGMDSHLGYETVRYKWNRPHVGWQDLVFRQAYLNDENREFSSTIADQGIVLQSKKQTGSFQFMLRSYMEKLRISKSMSNLHSSMGWKEDNTQFVIGERLYKRMADGSVEVDVISLSSSAGNVGKSMYTHAGSLSAWADATAILDKANMPHHMFALNTAFSSLLWQFTGLKGMTISLVGPTGGGKSIIQLMIQSVYGDPDKLHFSANSTNNAMFSRLGTYGNLPLTVDEATYMDDIGDFCYTVTQGRDKARLSRAASEREAREWATNVIVSTNIPWASKLNDGVEVDAQMARLMEVEIPVHKLFHKNSDAGSTIFHHLMENHGLAGDAIVRALLRMGEAAIKQRIKDTATDFYKMYGMEFTGSERFWQMQLVLQHVVCTIAEAEGIIKYDFRKGVQHGVDDIDRMRGKIVDSRVSGFDLIKDYLNEVAGDSLTIMHTDNQPAAIDQTRIPRGIVKAQFDVYRKTPTSRFEKGTVLIVRKQFKLWLAAGGYDYTKLGKELKDVGADATPHKSKCVLGKGTSLKVGQQYVVGINLKHNDMIGYLDDIQVTADNITLGQLALVP